MTELSAADLVRACGGLSTQTHIRAFSEANQRYTKILNTYGRNAGAKRPEAQKLERLMRMIENAI